MVRLILLRILESYFRHRWLYLLPVVILAITGGLYLTLREPKYLAQGVVFVQQESFIAELTSVRDVGISWNTPSQDIATEITDLMQTDAFVRAIVQETDLEKNIEKDPSPSSVSETIDTARKAVWAVSQGKNQVLIGASIEDPQVSVQLVNATINNFIQWKINSERLDSETALNFFQDLSETYKVELDSTREELINYLTAHPEPLRGDRPDQETLEIDRLQSDLQVAEDRYSRALDNIENARLALAQIESSTNQTYILIDAPTVPDKPESSRKDLAVQLAIFLVVGVILSVVGIGGSALLNRSFLFPVDVINLTGLPVLATVPMLKADKKSKRKMEKNATLPKFETENNMALPSSSSSNGSVEVNLPSEKQKV